MYDGQGEAAGRMGMSECTHTDTGLYCLQCREERITTLEAENADLRAERDRFEREAVRLKDIADKWYSEDRKAMQSEIDALRAQVAALRGEEG